jgi:DNA-binding NtrC family response regulator
VRATFDLCRRFARTTYPVLILGARGTGKTALAHHIHELSARAGTFVTESAAAIPEHMEVAHLAGHAQGSFTGAHRDRTGLIESAHRGTFFLDELGVASHRVQEMLLQLLDEGMLKRVGEVRTRPVDVRFVAATNENLDTAVHERRFRADLLDRFGYFVVRLPTLAERRDEILPLADHFLRLESERDGCVVRPAFTAAVRECLLAAAWEGNVRQLEAACRYAYYHADPGAPIGLQDLPADVVAPLGAEVRLAASRSARPVLDAASIAQALHESGGSVTRAAILLRVSRRHLTRLLHDARSNDAAAG